MDPEVRPGLAPQESGDTGARVKWTGLPVVLALSLGLCLIGYQVANRIGHPTLVQAAVVLLVLGLLRGWVCVNRPALSDASTQRVDSTPPVSVIRLALSPQGRRVRSQPDGEVSREGHRPLVGDRAAHSSLR